MSVICSRASPQRLSNLQACLVPRRPQGPAPLPPQRVSAGASAQAGGVSCPVRGLVKPSETPRKLGLSSD